MLWFKLKPRFEQNQCFLRPKHLLHKELFYTKTVFSTNTMFYTKTKTMFLLGLCKGCLQPTGQLFPWWPAEHAEGGWIYMRHDSGIHPDTLQNRGPFWLWTVSLWGCLWLTKGRALFWSLLFDNIRGCRGCRRSSLGNSLQLPWRTQIWHRIIPDRMAAAAEIAQQTRRGFQPPFLLWVQTLLLLTSVPNQSCDTCGTCDGNWSWLEAQTVEQRSPRAGEQRRLLAQWPCRDRLRSAEIRALSNLQIIEDINEIRFLCGLPCLPFTGWVWSPMTLTSFWSFVWFCS